MPFKSKAQMRLMYSRHPKIAKKWATMTPRMVELPEKAQMEKTMSSHSDLRKAVARQKKTQKTAKLGSGARFAALKNAIAARGGVRNPGAVAAAIGRKKYGNVRMAYLAAKGR